MPAPVFLGLLGGSDAKESAYKSGDQGSTPGLERPPGGGHGNPLQCFCYDFHSWVFLTPPPSELPLTHPHPLAPNSDSFPPGSTDHALAAFFPNKVIYFSPKNDFPIYGTSAPIFKIKTFLSTITHTWLILISKKSIFHYGLSLHFLVLLGTEVILSGGFLFVSIYVYLPSKR